MGRFDDLLAIPPTPVPGVYDEYIKPGLELGEEGLGAIASLLGPVSAPFHGVETAISGLAGLATKGDPLAYMKLAPGAMSRPDDVKAALGMGQPNVSTPSPYRLAKRGIQTAIEGQPYEGKQGFAETGADVLGEFGSQLLLDPVIGGMGALGKTQRAGGESLAALVQAAKGGTADLAMAQKAVDAVEAGRSAGNMNSALGAAFVPGMAAGALGGIQNTYEGYREHGLTPEVFGEGLQTAADTAFTGLGVHHMLAGGLVSLIKEGKIDAPTAAKILEAAQRTAAPEMVEQPDLPGMNVRGQGLGKSTQPEQLPLDLPFDQPEQMPLRMPVEKLRVPGQMPMDFAPELGPVQPTDRIAGQPTLVDEQNLPTAVSPKPPPAAPANVHPKAVVDALKGLGWRDDQIAKIAVNNAPNMILKQQKPADFGLSGEAIPDDVGKIQGRIQELQKQINDLMQAPEQGNQPEFMPAVNERNELAKKLEDLGINPQPVINKAAVEPSGIEPEYYEEKGVDTTGAAKALGWDTAKLDKLPPEAKDVIVDEQLKLEGTPARTGEPSRDLALEAAIANPAFGLDALKKEYQDAIKHELAGGKPKAGRSQGILAGKLLLQGVSHTEIAALAKEAEVGVKARTPFWQQTANKPKPKEVQEQEHLDQLREELKVAQQKLKDVIDGNHNGDEFNKALKARDVAHRAFLKAKKTIGEAQQILAPEAAPEPSGGVRDAQAKADAIEKEELEGEARDDARDLEGQLRQAHIKVRDGVHQPGMRPEAFGDLQRERDRIREEVKQKLGWARADEIIQEVEKARASKAPNKAQKAAIPPHPAPPVADKAVKLPDSPEGRPALPEKLEKLPTSTAGDMPEPVRVQLETDLQEHGGLKSFKMNGVAQFVADVAKKHGIELRVGDDGKLVLLTKQKSIPNDEGSFHHVFLLGKATKGPHAGKELVLRVGGVRGVAIPKLLADSPLVVPLIAHKTIKQTHNPILRWAKLAGGKKVQIPKEGEFWKNTVLDVTEYTWSPEEAGKTTLQHRADAIGLGTELRQIQGLKIKDVERNPFNARYTWRNGKFEPIVSDFGVVAPNIMRAIGDETTTPRHVTTAHIERELPGTKVKSLGERGWEIKLADGRTILIDYSKDKLSGWDVEDARKQHPEVFDAKGNLLPGKGVLGLFREGISADGIIALSKYHATPGTLTHEVFHAAMRLALSAKDRALVFNKYLAEAKALQPEKWDSLSEQERNKAIEEVAAEAYSKWKPETSHGLFRKIYKFFRGIYRAFRPDAEQVFEKVKSGEAWKAEKGVGLEATSESRLAVGRGMAWQTEREAERVYKEEYLPLMKKEEAARDTFSDTPVADKREAAYAKYKKLLEQAKTYRAMERGGPFMAMGDVEAKAAKTADNEEFVRMNLGLEAKKGDKFKSAVVKDLKRKGVQDKDIELLFQVYKNRPDDFQKVFNDVVKNHWGDYLLEAYKAGLVSGVPTKIANLASNVTMRGLRDIENVVAAGLDAARVKLTGGARERYLGEYSAGWHGYLSELGPAMSDWLGGHAEMAKLQPVSQKGLGRFLGGGALDVDLARIGGIWKGKKGEAIRTGFKSLDVDDALFKHISAAQELYRSLYREGRQSGLGHKAALDNVQVVGKDIVSHIKQGEIPRKYLPLLKQLETTARRDTFQSPMQGIFRLGEQAVRSSRPAQGLIPFYRTPVNIMLETLLRTPAGFVKGPGSLGALYKAYKTGSLSGAHMEELAKPIVGSLIAAGIFSYALKGGISGGGPQSYNEGEAKKETGWLPYSLKVGDQWISYQRIEPLSSILGMAADMAEAGKYGDTASIGKFASRLTGSVLENLTSKTFLAGLEGLFTALHDPKQYAERYIKQMEASVVPNIIGKAAQAIDPNVRRTEVGKSPIQARIPFWSKNLEPRHAPSGEDLKRPGSALERFASPFTRSTEKQTPEADVAREMERVGFAPGQVKDFMGIEGHKVSLTPEERQSLVEARLKATKALTRVIHDPSYTRLPDTVDEAEFGARTKEMTLRRVYERYMAQARARIRGAITKRAREESR